MSYLPTEAKFVGPTETYYIIYEHSFTGKARDGSTYKRTQTRVKRVYISGKLLKWKVGTFTNKRGKSVYGVVLIYKNPVKGYSASRDRTKYKVSKKFVIVKKVVAVPRNAKNIYVSKSAPKGPLMEIT